MSTMRVKATLSPAEYNKGIKEMKARNSEFGNGLGKIGGLMKKAFAVGAILGVVRALSKAVMGLVDFGSKLSDMSAQTGISVESFQRLQRAVRDAGGEDQNLVNSLARIRDAQGDVLSGNEETAKKFERLGISIEEVASMDTGQLFERISKAITDSGNSAKEFSAVADIIGQRNAPKLLEAMNLAAGGVENLGKGLETMSTKDAQALDLVADKWAQFKNNIKTGAAVALASIFRLSDKTEGEIGKRVEQAEKMSLLEQEQRSLALKELQAKQEEERLAKLEEVRRKEQEITEERKKQIAEIEQSVKIEIDTNQIRRIGGFAGARVSDTLKYARQQTELTSKIAEFTASLPKIEQNTKNGGLG